MSANTGNLTSAETFETCFRQCNQEYSRLDITSAQSIAPINLGKINLDSLDSVSGKYDQKPDALRFLNFYMRGRYQNISAEHQKVVLDFLKDRCLKDDGTVEVHHVNRAFVFGRSSL